MRKEGREYDYVQLLDGDQVWRTPTCKGRFVYSLFLYAHDPCANSHQPWHLPKTASVAPARASETRLGSAIARARPSPPPHPHRCRSRPAARRASSRPIRSSRPSPSSRSSSRAASSVPTSLRCVASAARPFRSARSLATRSHALVLNLGASLRTGRRGGGHLRRPQRGRVPGARAEAPRGQLHRG